MADESFDLKAGGVLPLYFWVTDENGAPVPNAGASAEASVTSSGGYQELAEITPDGANEWKLIFGAAYSLNLAGRRARVRVWITPASSVETTPIDVFVNVKV